MRCTLPHNAMTVGLLTAAVMLAACMKPSDGATTPATAPTSARAAHTGHAATHPPAQAAFRVHSRVAGFHAMAITVLPTAPKAATLEQGGFCADVAIHPETAGGRDAVAKGWLVTTETTAAGYTSVGIFSQGESGTSGACFITDGNVVVYRDAQPVALIYGDPPTRDAGNKIGGAQETYTPNRLRIVDRSPADFPSADIVLKPHRIDVVPIAESETVCGLTIPKLYGLNPTEARALLGKTGWKPEPGEDRATGAASMGRLRDNGELTDCSGTGFGFCKGGYAHRSGATMEFITVGDEAHIVRYDVQCPKKRRIAARAPTP